MVGGWIRDNLGPVGKIRDAGAALGALTRVANDLPIFADRVGRMSEELESMTANGLRFDKATAEAIGKAEARHTRSGRVALWVIAIAVVVYVVHSY